jgi:hypothetical protein
VQQLLTRKIPDPHHWQGLLKIWHRLGDRFFVMMIQLVKFLDHLNDFLKIFKIQY